MTNLNANLHTITDCTSISIEDSQKSSSSGYSSANNKKFFSLESENSDVFFNRKELKKAHSNHNFKRKIVTKFRNYLLTQANSKIKNCSRDGIYFSREFQENSAEFKPIVNLTHLSIYGPAPLYKYLLEEGFVRSPKKEFTEDEQMRLKVNKDLVDKIFKEVNSNTQNSPNLVNLFNFVNRSLKDHYCSFLETKVYVKEKESDKRYYKNFIVKKN